MKALAFATILGAVVPTPVLAVDCHSVGGHLNGRPISVVRQLTLNGDQLSLTGWFLESAGASPVKAPLRVLSCVALHAGVLCKQEFGPVTVSVMSNGNRLVETITDRETGKESSGIAYECDGTLQIK
jgi:hypothetical protein